MASERILERIRKVLALTTSPSEGEAAAASEMLERMLIAHNLSIADLEHRGQAVKPNVGEINHDVGKRAYPWKLHLAEHIASRFFCIPLVDYSHYGTSVKFVGRPDNVQSLQMLYDWLVGQIERIAREERPSDIHQVRWQRSFGDGAEYRLSQRLKENTYTDTATTGLIISLASENSDWLEEHYGYRKDGRKTKEQEESERRWAEERRRKAELLARDPDGYYREYPWERPETAAERERRQEEDRKYYAKLEAQRERMANARAYRRTAYTDDSYEASRNQRQRDRAYDAGRAAGERINLQPFVKGGNTTKNPELA